MSHTTLTPKMPSASRITADLLHVYAATIYEVQIEGAWINAATWQPAVDGQHPRSMISACNPWSQSFTEADNQRRYSHLLHQIQFSGMRWWPARGRSPDDRWLEPSFLVEGPLAVVDHWARAYGQHAIWLPPQSGALASIRLYAEPPVPELALDLPHVQLEWVGCGPTQTA